jgi:hypothetical protein
VLRQYAPAKRVNLDLRDARHSGPLQTEVDSADTSKQAQESHAITPLARLVYEMYNLYAMYQSTPEEIFGPPPLVTLDAMARKAEGKRYFVKMSEGHRHKLDFLTVAAKATSSEEYGGRLLCEVIDRLWERFDPKAADKPAKPKAAK